MRDVYYGYKIIHYAVNAVLTSLLRLTAPMMTGLHVMGYGQGTRTIKTEVIGMSQSCEVEHEND